MKVAVLLVAAVGIAAAAAPDCSLVPGWQQHGPARTFEGESLYEYMDGNSEGYLAYGFQRMKGVSCKKGGVTIHVDISEMRDTEAAYGIFSANRDVSRPVEKLGMAAQIVPRKAIIAKDRYYLEIAAEPDADHTATLRELATALEKRVEGRTELPDIVRWFPQEQISAGSPRLIPQSVLGIGLLKQGYMALYENKAKAVIVREASPEAATAVFGKLQARFSETQPAQLGDGGFVATDRYLGRICFFRKGGYLAGYAGVPEGQDALAMATQLAARLP